MLLEENNPHGGDIYCKEIKIDFSANVVPFGIPETIKNSIKEAVNDLDKYPDPYCRDLKKAIAKHEGVNENFILCSNGAAEMIFSFVFALKPKRAIIVSPTFCEYERALLTVGCEVSHYFLKEEEDFEITDSLLEHISSACDAVFVCNPNNPVGNLCHKDLLLKIASKCKAEKVYLFLDECFMDLTYNPKKYSMAVEIKKNDFLFILKAFTKSYGLAGLRLGYAICSDRELLNRICKNTQVWNVSYLAQKAGCTALECSEYMGNLRLFIKEERSFLKRELEKLDIKVFDGEANFLFFKSSKNLYNGLMDKGICIRDCSNFKGLSLGFFRCSVRSHEDNLILLNEVKEILING